MTKGGAITVSPTPSDELVPEIVRGVQELSLWLGIAVTATGKFVRDNPSCCTWLSARHRVGRMRAFSREQVISLRRLLPIWIEDRHRHACAARELARRRRPERARQQALLQAWIAAEGTNVPAVGEKKGRCDYFGSALDAKKAIAAERRLERARAKERNCLGCRRTFMSLGPEHRLCDPCRSNT